MKRITLLMMVVVLASCGSSKGTTTGNPLVNFSMTSSGSAATVAKTFLHKLFSLLVPTSVAKAPPAQMVDAHGNTVTVSAFWISLGEVEFKPSETVESGEVDGSDVEFVGPYTVDMLADTPVTLGTGSLTNSQFRRIKYKLSRVQSLPAGAPAGISGKAVYISGTINGNAFTFVTPSEIEMSVAGANLVGAQNADSLLLQIQLANLIKKIDFSAITSSTVIDDSNRVSSGSSPCPLIDTSATDIYNCLMAGLSTEGNLGRDLNGDGEFEASEPTVK